MSFIEFFLGMLLVYSILKALVRRREEAYDQGVYTNRQFTKTEIIVVKIEEINGIYYLWDKDSEDFLAQGPTVEEALKIMVERFPDKVFRSENVITQA